MEEINILDLFSYYIKKLPIIIIVTVLFLLLGYFYVTEVKVPMYHGSTTIILVQKNEESTSSQLATTEFTLNEKLVATYSEVIKSRKVLDRVIEDLELDLTAKELSGKISVSSVSGTSIIKIMVSDENNKKAVKIANKIASVFEEEIVKIYNLENISVIDKAIVEKVPYNISLIKQTLIFGIAGGVLVCGIIFIIYYFDTTIKNKDEIEERLSIAVISEIPNMSKSNIKSLSNVRSTQKLKSVDVRNEVV